MRLVTPRLLITDDDRDFRETVAGVLIDRGFETLQAAGGEEALEIVSRHEVHLLLLDMQMPRLSGLETIERLRERQSVGWDKLAGTAAQRWSSSAGPPLSPGGPARAALAGPTLRLDFPALRL
jgi:CheY-like chemotaxis protein